MSNAYYPDLNNKFPLSVDDFDRFLDPTLADLEAIKKFYSYRDAGNLEEANAVIADNPRLKNEIVNADTLNKLRDAIIAAQRYYLEIRDNGILEDIMGCVKYAGTYNRNSTYQKFNVTDYAIDSAYQCYIAIADTVPKNTPPTDMNYWKCITLRGKQGQSGIGLSPRGIWNDIMEYSENDMVAFENSLWAASRDNVGKIPSKMSSDWYLVIEYNGDWMTYDNTESGLNANYIPDAIDEIVEKINETLSMINVIAARTYTKADVGLSNADNTADSQKSVNYANSSGTASKLNGMTFNWSGQSGQPSWLWGSNDGNNMYVYNPANFNVNYANSAGSASSATNATNASYSGNTTPGTASLKNAYFTTAAPAVGSAMTTGNICLVYE